VEDGVPRDGGRLGMYLFLASLAMLFGAGIIAHLVIRLRLPAWPPEGSPALPAGLWVSTAILLVGDAVLLAAKGAVRRDDSRGLRRLLAAAMCLGLAFLAMQTANWLALADAVAATGQNLFTFTYWALTVLHGLHVLGGLVPTAVAVLRSPSGRYGSLNPDPVANLALYWHFLTVTWLAILAVLVL
jgi:cytochrome c oxidase subunit 3